MSDKNEGFFNKIFGSPAGKKASPTETVGGAGASIYGGYIQQNEKSSALTGTEKYRTYSNMMANVSIIASGVRYFLNMVSKPEWKVEPAEDTGSDATAEEYAMLIDDMMGAMQTPWHRVVRRAAMYRFYGYSVQEWTAVRREDGAFGLLDVAPRPQLTIERWDVDPHGTLLGVWQRIPQTSEEVYLPRSKIVYMVDDTLNDSPEGLGLFRSIVSAADTLQRYEQLEGFGFETDLRGIPVARIPYAALQKAVDAGEISAADATTAKTALESFITKHIKNPQLGLALDSLPYLGSTADGSTVSALRQWDVDLLSGEGGNFEAVGKAIERLTFEIAQTLGVEKLLLGQSKGTQALSKDKSDNFFMVVDSTLAELQEVFQRDFVERIFALNGWDTQYLPKLKTDKVQFRDVEEITSAIDDMARAGAVLAPDDPAINEVRDLLGISHAPDDVIGRALDAAIPNATEEDPDPTIEEG